MIDTRRMPAGRPPGWLTVVRVVAVVAAGVVLLAVADVGQQGFTRPWTALLGLVGTAFVNRVYVTMAQRGSVLEAIDIAEAPIIALALLLPPGEAVLVFVLASLLMEMRLERARVKKVFNVGVRAVGAAILVVPLWLVDARHTFGAREVIAAIVGACGYTTFTAVAIALVVASVQGRRVRAVLREGIGARILVWVMAITIGVAGAEVAVVEPAALVGIVAALVLLSISARSAERMQRQHERVRHLLDATTRIQSTEAVEEQEKVLVEVASDTLLWKHVEVRNRPPHSDEIGRQLSARDGSHRWLVASREPGSDPWLPDDENVVDFLARSASVAFERSTLQEDLARQALLDPLTGVANRRHFDHEIARLAAGRRGYGVVLCDLDHFKTVNDRLGHDIGDELLRIAAARLSASVRAQDLIARLGGDEFVVLLPGLTSREALQRIRDTIAERFDQRVQVGRWQLSSLPCSLGTASGPRDGQMPREVLRAADESMYDAKRERRSGPQRVTVTLPEAPKFDLGDSTVQPIVRPVVRSVVLGEERFGELGRRST